MQNGPAKYTTEKLGTFPAKVVDCKIGDRNGVPQYELTVVVNINGEPHQAIYKGDSKPEFVQYAIDAFVTAGFKGKGWNDLKKGVTSETFDVVDFNASIVKVTSTKDGSSFLEAKYINPARKEFEGQVNDMAGSFAAARQKKGIKPNASAPSNGGW